MHALTEHIQMKKREGVYHLNLNEEYPSRNAKTINYSQTHTRKQKIKVHIISA